jgi:amidohydrolase
MIDDGVLETRPGGRDGAVREIFCIHVDPDLEVGRFGLRSGAVTAATAPWEVHITSGGSGHSARPQETVDTVWVATQILNTFYQLPGRIHDARRTAVLTACRFRAGQALNVIPAEVEFGGTLRCVDFDALHFLAKKMEAVAKEAGVLYDAKIEFAIDDNLPPVINDEVLVDFVSGLIEEEYGKEAVHTIPEPSMGGEDFAFYAQEVPGMLLRVGTRSGPETSYPLHHTLFDVTERALPQAARLMADVITRRLGGD